MCLLHVVSTDQLEHLLRKLLPPFRCGDMGDSACPALLYLILRIGRIMTGVFRCIGGNNVCDSTSAMMFMFFDHPLVAQQEVVAGVTTNGALALHNLCVLE